MSGSLHPVLAALREMVVDRDQVIGSSTDQLIPPESRDPFQAAIVSLVATGEPTTYELVVVIARNTTELKASQADVG